MSSYREPAGRLMMQGAQGKAHLPCRLLSQSPKAHQEWGNLQCDYRAQNPSGQCSPDLQLLLEFAVESHEDSVGLLVLADGQLDVLLLPRGQPVSTLGQLAEPASGPS